MVQGQVADESSGLANLCMNQCRVVTVYQEALARVDHLRSRTKKGERNRAGRLRFFNWNTGGLATSTLDSMLEWWRLQDIDIAAVQETRWIFDGEWFAPGCFCIHSASSEHKGQAGLLT